MVLQESPPETRVPLIPAVAKKLVKLGLEVFVETRFGEHRGFAEPAYRKADAEV